MMVCDEFRLMLLCVAEISNKAMLVNEPICTRNQYVSISLYQHSMVGTILRIILWRRKTFFTSKTVQERKCTLYQYQCCMVASVKYNYCNCQLSPNTLSKGSILEINIWRWGRQERSIAVYFCHLQNRASISFAKVGRRREMWSEAIQANCRAKK